MKAGIRKLQLGYIIAGLITGVNSGALASSLSNVSRHNENVGVFINVSSRGVQQGITEFALTSKDDKGVLELARRAINAGYPTRKVRRSTGGYAERTATIVTILKNYQHTIEIDLDPDLGLSADFIVTSNNLTDEVHTSLDAFANASVSLSGNLAKDFKEVLLKLNPNKNGSVISLSDIKTIYDVISGGKNKNGVACGNLSTVINGSDSCIVFAN